MKRLFSILLAVLLLASLCAAAFAEETTPDYSITVNNAKPGETYTAYKMLDLSVDDPTDPTAYRYTVNPAWAAFATTDEFKAVYTVDDQGYVTSTVSSETAWSATSALSTLAEKAAAYAVANGISEAGHVTIAANADSGKINLTEPGYYVVSSTLGSRAMIITTPANPAATINEKNEEDTIEKEVQEDSTEAWGESNDAQVGDTVYFKSKVKVVPRSINVVIHDKMDDGLAFSGNSSIKLYTDEACTSELDSGLYTIKPTPDTGDTFTIVISDNFAAATTEDKYIYITYSAVLDKDAITDTPAIDPQTNDTHVTFGDNTSSEHDTTTTTTHKFEVLKYKTGDKTHNLAGAVFQLLKGSEVVKLIKIDATNYRVADATESTGTASSHANNGELNTVAAGSLVSDFVTVDSGNIVIWGVDSDTDYKLKEIQPPKGYNELASEVDVEVNANNTTVIEVENKTGSELPSTGGIGTTLFYVIGGLMVAGATVVLVSKKRMM